MHYNRQFFIVCPVLFCNRFIDFRNENNLRHRVDMDTNMTRGSGIITIY